MASLPIVPLAGPPLRDDTIVSEQVPQLYRLILDLVAELEVRGLRRDARRARAEAIAAYSSGWDVARRQHLERIAEQLQRRLTRPTVRERLHLG